MPVRISPNFAKGLSIVGIAGEDFLSRFNYMLDYDQRGLRSS